MLLPETHSALTGDAASMLARMFGDGALQSARDSRGRVFIDRDGSLFSFILQWLRDRRIPPHLTASQLQALRIEADFHQPANWHQQFHRLQGNSMLTRYQI
jgi:BTB/POZ domain